MTYKEETYLLDSVKQLKHQVYENTLMLQGICNVVNVYLANHHKENEEDFGRNVLANLISGVIDIRGMKK